MKPEAFLAGLAVGAVLGATLPALGQFTMLIHNAVYGLGPNQAASVRCTDAAGMAGRPGVPIYAYEIGDLSVSVPSVLVRCPA